MTDIVDLGLSFTGSSRNIRPEALTLHYAGPSMWGNVDRSSPAAFYMSANHLRCPSIVRAEHAYHLAQGWFGLAYNDVVCPHGTIYKGRGPGFRSGANGSDYGNLISPAIEYLAGVDDPLTDQAKFAFHECQARYGVPLRWPHNHWFNTGCPGSEVERWIGEGFPLPFLPTPVPPKRKVNSDMDICNNTDGRLEMFDVSPAGTVVNIWEGTDHKLNGWAPLTVTQPFVAGSVNARNATPGDGRIVVVATDSTFGIPWITMQSAPGAGPWTEWVRLQDWLNFLASLSGK